MFEVKVKRKSGEIVKFMVDDADYLSVVDYKWYFRENRFINYQGKLLHHLLFNHKNFNRKYSLGFKDGNIFNYQRDNIVFYHGKFEN
jgi:hypothetical protein